MTDKLPRKKVLFRGSALKDLRGFPEAAQDALGYALDHVQARLDPPDWGDMSTVGAGCKELRYQDRDGWYRVVYVATFEEYVAVLHSFQKKTNQTSKQDIAVAKQRFDELIQERKQERKKK